jgi:nicotinate phosphoribosyltransferase
MVELRRDGQLHYTAKFSDAKRTLPGAKQIFRLPDRDVIALSTECSGDFGQAEPLLRPVINRGELVEPLPSLAKARARSAASIEALPPQFRDLDTVYNYQVDVSPKLIELAESIRSDVQLARQ